MGRPSKDASRMRKQRLVETTDKNRNADQPQDQTSSRSNTLFDDADDIQRQLDNEARDRLKYGRPKTIWVFHFPMHVPENTSLKNSAEKLQLERHRRDMAPPEPDPTMMTTPLPPLRDWEYSNQADWAKTFPDCGGKSQSPVDMPTSSLIKARGARKLLFQNYNVEPKTLTLANDGRRVVLFGKWKKAKHPLIYGGAAHGRRYLFHSLTLHLPSEHTIGGLRFPMESQSLYISAEYKNMEKAIEASPSDPQAFLGVSNIYKYSNYTHHGIIDLLAASKAMVAMQNVSVAAKPLHHFNPPFNEYVCYQGSMTTPPCTESVLWLIRGRTLPVQRECLEAAQELLTMDNDSKHFRDTQAMNDRKVFIFK